jgi:hypothetical protein
LSADGGRVATCFDNALASEIAKQEMHSDVVDEFQDRTRAIRFLVWFKSNVPVVPRI